MSNHTYNRHGIPQQPNTHTKLATRWVRVKNEMQHHGEKRGEQRGEQNMR